MNVIIRGMKQEGRNANQSKGRSDGVRVKGHRVVYLLAIKMQDPKDKRRRSGDARFARSAE